MESTASSQADGDGAGEESAWGWLASGGGGGGGGGDDDDPSPARVLSEWANYNALLRMFEGEFYREQLVALLLAAEDRACYGVSVRAPDLLAACPVVGALLASSAPLDVLAKLKLVLRDALTQHLAATAKA